MRRALLADLQAHRRQIVDLPPLRDVRLHALQARLALGALDGGRQDHRIRGGDQG